jgi:hypothetical protein
MVVAAEVCFCPALRNTLSAGNRAWHQHRDVLLLPGDMVSSWFFATVQLRYDCAGPTRSGKLQWCADTATVVTKNFAVRPPVQHLLCSIDHLRS